MSQLNLRIRGLPPSATVAINELSDQLRSGGRRIFKMGLGQRKVRLIGRPLMRPLDCRN